jgi:hypothetical protein
VIIELSADRPPTLTDADRLDRLHATSEGVDGTQYGEDSCGPGPDADHVWVDVEWLRRNATAQVTDPTFGERFEAMIAYAASKGWLDESGRRVRAHIER